MVFLLDIRVKHDLTSQVKGKIINLLHKIDGDLLKLSLSMEMYKLLHSKLLGKVINVKVIKTSCKKDTALWVTTFNFCKRFSQIL